MRPRKGESKEEANARQRAARAAAKQAVPQPTIPERHHVRGVSTLVDRDGTVRAQWIKTAQDHEEREEMIRRLVAELPKEIAPRKGSIDAPRVERGSEELMAVYPLGDPHVGLLAWAEESGDDFDLDECERLMTSAMRDLVLRGPRAHRALIINLGDFFHSDGHGTTTKGTRVECDSRTAKVLAVGLRIMVSLIDAALEHHELVTVDNRIGNHDGYTALVLALALAEHYRLEPRVTIPPPTSHRSYHSFGTNLIGVTHGDRAKPEALAEIMAAERPEEWGRTRHRVWYVGHVHHQVVKEHRGCRVESFRTLAARDGWHAGEGYVAGRDAHRIVLHKTRGEVERAIVNVSSLIKEA